MIPSMTALARTRRQPGCAGSASSTCRWGATSPRWTPPGESGALDELSPILGPLQPVKKHVTASRNLELQNAYPGTHATSNAAFLSAARAKRTESTDYYLGTTVDQIAAQQIGQETQLPSLELSMDLLRRRRPVRQRLRLRLSEQPVVVVADDAAAGRGAPADRVRAPLRRGRQPRGPPGRAEEAGQPARLGDRRDRPAAEPARPRRPRPRSASTSTPSARWSAASRRPRADARTIRCPTSTAPWACRPPTPTTPG